MDHVERRSSGAVPAGASGRISHPDPGKGFAARTGVTQMGFFKIPVRITLKVEKTRTGWIMTVRIDFLA